MDRNNSSFFDIAESYQRQRADVSQGFCRQNLSACEIHLGERAQGRSSRWAPPTNYTNGSPVVRMVFEPAQQSRAFDALQEVPNPDIQKKGRKKFSGR